MTPSLPPSTSLSPCWRRRRVGRSGARLGVVRVTLGVHTSVHAAQMQRPISNEWRQGGVWRARARDRDCNLRARRVLRRLRVCAGGGRGRRRRRLVARPVRRARRPGTASGHVDGTERRVERRGSAVSSASASAAAPIAGPISAMPELSRLYAMSASSCRSRALSAASSASIRASRDRIWCSVLSATNGRFDKTVQPLLTLIEVGDHLMMEAIRRTQRRHLSH